ncbi:hypothetical protein BDF20DRAFT_803957, partial [Mycotypha africana]|uniref:uncharacterized protein n=1 Tax=Mycotypha africana TaxID=64632 RepID=UPI002300F8D9
EGIMYDDAGIEVVIVEMNVDNETYSLESITNYNEYVDLKPPETPAKQELETVIDEKPPKRKNVSHLDARYTNAQRTFLSLMYERDMSVRAAAMGFKIAPRAARRCVKKDEDGPD